MDNLLTTARASATQSPESLWAACVDLLYRGGALGPGAFALLSSAHPSGYDNGALVIVLPSDFHVQWIESHNKDDILRALEVVAGARVPLRLTTGTAPVETPAVPEPDMLPPPAVGFLNDAFTFDSFVVGKSNELAHAACVTVAKNPGTYYNPLFIYGGTGLGKTHLLHAIGHLLMRHHPGATVRYVSSEDFTNDLVSAIYQNTPHEFRKRYRSLKLLLIDDIHFIARKDSMQEEFFHTFNTLHRKKSQIVITSDRPPHETKLEQRLISRFESGLIADIQPPEFETRAAILYKKTAMMGLSCPPEVMTFIINNASRNVRQIEGCLVRLAAHAALGKDLDLAEAKRILADIIQSTPATVSVEEIIRATASATGLQAGALTSKRRTMQIAQARQVAMYLTRSLTSLSTTDIGRYFGGRDHSTVIHACAQVRHLMETRAGIKSLVETLEETLRNTR
ncbi:chromosomal replication initiator protein DnaA [Candidatus Fermentibacteria bacterium]|nr:chromosomal replication initiator protein DnaA [Candidatus Fermentibacteria bacterium]